MKYERSVPQPEAERGIGTAGQSGRGTVGDCGTLGKRIFAHFYAAHKLHAIYFACCKSKISIKSNVCHNVLCNHNNNDKKLYLYLMQHKSYYFICFKMQINLFLWSFDLPAISLHSLDLPFHFAELTVLFERIK